MRTRLLIGTVAALVLAVGAAAPASGATVKTVLQVSMEEALEPTGTRVATLRGDTVVKSQPYCEQKRKIELFLDGKKIAGTESDRYGGWFFSLKPLQSGRYVAKTKKAQLPNKVICSAAQSEAVVVP